MSRNITLILSFWLCSMGLCQAQYESAGAYMMYLNNQEEALAKDYVGYISAANHGLSARKLEKSRTALLKTVNEVRQNTLRLKPWQGDGSLRDAFATYYTILVSVLNEDYGKIVNLEEIAEQSYDNMEAYLMAQELAGTKLNEAAKERTTAFREFALRNNIKLVETENNVSRKIEKSGQVNRYCNQLYLIFFKSNKQEYHMVEAFNTAKVGVMEQNRSGLLSYSKEGLQKLDSIRAFEDDSTLVTMCRKILLFYRDESENKVPQVIAFHVKRAEFEKAKARYQASSGSPRPESEIAAYNNMVRDMNRASDGYNQINKELNTNRIALTDQWIAAVKKFLDGHTPR